MTIDNQNAWNEKIVADMQLTIDKIERAIETATDLQRILPTIGDSRPMPIAYWRNEIAKNHKWIDGILNGESI